MQQNGPLKLCRRCGEVMALKHCRSEYCLKERARLIIRRRAWAGRWFVLSALLAAASSLLIAFYETNGWRQRVLEWCVRHEYYDLAVQVNSGAWGGLTWNQWSAVGMIGAAILLSLWLVLSLSAAWKMRSIPGLERLVKAEQEHMLGFWSIVGALALIPLFIIIVAAIAGAAGSSGHHHDARDIDGL